MRSRTPELLPVLWKCIDRRGARRGRMRSRRWFTKSTYGNVAQSEEQRPYKPCALVRVQSFQLPEKAIPPIHFSKRPVEIQGVLVYDFAHFVEKWRNRMYD